MIKSMVVSAVFAGFAAGLFTAALQFAFVEPVLLEAELYETGAKVHVPGGGDGHEHDHAVAEVAPVIEGAAAVEVAPANDRDPVEVPAQPTDWTRAGLTVLFIALVNVGYALLMVAGFALAQTRGIRITPRAGIIWGLCGFIALHFAPAAGLPPELPGMTAAELLPRQVWWVSTVVATIAGLALVGYGQGWAAWGLGAVLIFLPHLIGAPHPHEFFGPTPPELAAQFAGRALAVGMAGWVVLGLAAGWFWQREEAAA